MHNPESVLEKETYKLHSDFKIQTDHLISARQPNVIIINKIKSPGGAQSKIERKWKGR